MTGVYVPTYRLNHASSEYLIPSSTEPVIRKLFTPAYVVLLMAPLKTDCFTILSTTFCHFVTPTRALWKHCRRALLARHQTLLKLTKLLSVRNNTLVVKILRLQHGWEEATVSNLALPKPGRAFHEQWIDLQNLQVCWWKIHITTAHISYSHVMQSYHHSPLCTTNLEYVQI